MGTKSTATDLPPHVLIFPVPLQGHTNSMLKLAELLCLSNVHVTMLLSEYTHGRLLSHGNLDSLFSGYPGFRVTTITDGLPDDSTRTGMEVVGSLSKIGEAELRKLMETTDALSDGGARRRVSCLILDLVLGFAFPVAEDLGIPTIYFSTVSACAFWATFRLKEVMEAGDLPLKGKDEDKYTYWKKPEMDLIVKSIPGMESFLRRRDLPYHCRIQDVNDRGFHMIMQNFRRVALSGGLIINTFEDLESQILDEIRKPIPNIYSVGPIHTHLKALKESQNSKSSLSSTSFWEEDGSSVAWLDSQPADSVLYVSFGSLTQLTRNELLEFWYGLVNSGHKFLWVMRPGSIMGEDDDKSIPPELEEGTKERGCIVGWVSQNEVLAHPAVAAFFTHNGWNSTMESIAAGVPMICWPNFADQTVNSRFVSQVWKVGLDMKDTCDRAVVEKTVREIMEERKDEFMERARGFAESAKKAISEGGSSSTDLNKLIEFIRSSV